VSLRPVLVVAIAWAGLAARAEPVATAEAEPAAAVVAARKSRPVVVAAEELDAAIARGRAFLVGKQNTDGSFGSAERTKDLNIMAGVGSHFGFRAATTALAVQALIEEDDGSPAVAAAIDRGERWLLAHLPDVRRDDPTMIYNVWAHAYGIQALVAMHGRRPDDAARRGRIESLIRGQFEKLAKYESAQGGWGYYDFTAGTQRPASSSTSFVNATVLIAMHDARDIDVEPASDTISGQTLPGHDFNFYCLDLTNTAAVRTFSTSSAVHVVFCQAEDREWDRVAPVFAAMTTSLVRGLVRV
jgi:hypothetical protein